MGENGGNSPDTPDMSQHAQTTVLICYVVVMATECVYAGGECTKGVEDGPDSADMEEERGCV